MLVIVWGEIFLKGLFILWFFVKVNFLLFVYKEVSRNIDFLKEKVLENYKILFVVFE